MGIVLSRRRRRRYHMVIVGLDAAGKSTLLYQLRFRQYIATTPTIGFNFEQVRLKLDSASARGTSVTFDVWDVGGQDKVRPLWRSYTRTTDGILFVVDSGDVERLEEAKVELLRTARVHETLGVPICVVANKNDLPASRSCDEITRHLGLADVLAGRPWSVHSVCAVTGEGLDDAVLQLYGMIAKRRKSTTTTKKR